MKHTSKHNAGFTLIELVVAMAIAVVVTAAATSVLLMGMRVNRQTGDTASQQMTVRTLLSVVEDAAADGSIQDVITDYDSWQLVDTSIGKNEVKPSYRVIFGFDSETQTIYTGRVVKDGEIDSQGTIVLEGVYASNVIIEEKLLSISVETKEGVFSSSIYCRTTELGDSGTNQLPGDGVAGGRGKFIEILKSQYRSRGTIWEKVSAGQDENGNPKYSYQDTGEYYSEWYIGRDYDDTEDDNGWNYKTPWCACYISWALNELGDNVTQPLDRQKEDSEGNAYYQWYANVDDFMEYFTPKNATETETPTWKPGGKEPEAGDLIFFDWNKGDDPSHVGVVLSVKKDGERTIVYTIEGNSAGRVAVRSYSLTDPRIIGYGILFAEPTE